MGPLLRGSSKTKASNWRTHFHLETTVILLIGTENHNCPGLRYIWLLYEYVNPFQNEAKSDCSSTRSKFIP